MCRFNQHWLADYNSTTKHRLLYLRHVWSCHRDLAVPRLRDSPFSGPISQPTCVISFQESAGILMSDACHARSHSSNISNAFDRKKRESKTSSWFATSQKHEGMWGDHESLRCSLMAFKLHNICVCNATRNAERPGSPRCVWCHFHTNPLLLSPAFCIHRSLHCFMPHNLSLLYFLSTYFTLSPFLILFFFVCY